jgi:aerobic carbon-monoxide dehydrogenase large subunit
VIGEPVRRVEDAALVTGHGTFLDDVRPDGTMHAFVIRSPLAHAVITAIDTSGTTATVFTADDFRHVGPLPGPRGLQAPALPLLRAPGDKVRWVGEPVALVVAGTPAEAADAAEQVVIDYDPLDAVTDPEQAAGPAAPRLHENGNVVFRQRLTGGDAATAFSKAARTVRQRMVSQRIAPVALEPRGTLAEPGQRLTVRMSTQRPHEARQWLAAMFGLPEQDIRVIAGDMGGAFGAKGPLYPDQVAVIAAAIALRRPVKWVEERTESFLATTHGRDMTADLEMAVSGDGRITAIRGTVHAGLGAYLTPNAASSVINRMAPLLGQCYALDAVDVELTGVTTNTTPIGPYRGAGRPEAAYFTERLADLAGRSAGLDPAEIRRRSFIPASAFPYTTCTGLSYDSGDYQAALDKAMPGYRALRREQQAARAEGRRYGVGLCCFVEPGGIMPGKDQDQATVTVTPDGKVTVAVGTSGHGQGHQTAFAQVAADLLGVPFEDVTVVHGDTELAPFGWGTFGSRSAVAGSAAVVRACEQVLGKARRVDAPMPVAEAARRLGGLTATAAAGVTGVTYASGCYVVAAEVDAETGLVEIRKVIAVDDCGTVINPLLVEGQVHGAVAQGVGQALYEQIRYDEQGQPLTASLMDYAVPSAAHVPAVESARVETPSPLNPLGVKGMGESGTIGVTPAIVSAVTDALGIDHLDMPLTAEKVWNHIK